MASASSFGEHLRREREMRGVSITEISTATRISTKFLEAIENGQWDQLPGGAFNRGYIRSTSRYLGLDEDSMVAEYALETNGNGTSHAHRLAAVHPGRTNLFSMRSGIIIGAILLLVALAWLVSSKLGSRSREHNQPAKTSILLPAAAPNLQST